MMVWFENLDSDWDQLKVKYGEILFEVAYYGERYLPLFVAAGSLTKW